MTYCIGMAMPIIVRIEKGETLKHIESFFPEVRHPRLKIIRIITKVIGKEFLIQHAKTLGYNPRKVTRKKPVSFKQVNRKIVPHTLGCDESKVESALLLNRPINLRNEIDGLIAEYGFRQVLNALASHNSEVKSIVER